MVLGTLAEHSLPFTMAPVIVNLAQTLAEDKVALSRMLSRTSAKYKMVHGLGKTFSDRILSNTGKLPFSLNLDEATSNSDKKVIIVLIVIPSIYTVLLTPKAIKGEHWPFLTHPSAVIRKNNENIWPQYLLSIRTAAKANPQGQT